MWKSCLAVIAAVTALGCGGAVTTSVPEPAPPPRDGVFIHISHGSQDAHRVLMALRMAEMMATDRDVLVYFDIDGIEVVLAGAVDIQHEAFPNSLDQISKLLDLGVPLYACPGCLAAAGKTADDLANGIEVANKDAFFDFTEGRILTLDY
jgi:predicted peroxiredoxin